MDDTVIKKTPIVVGAVYKTKRYEDVSEEILCLSAINDRGVRKGTFRRYGYADEVIEEGDERLVNWEILFNPREVALQSDVEKLPMLPRLPKNAPVARGRRSAKKAAATK
jgi:hypothetical protein